MDRKQYLSNNYSDCCAPSSCKVTLKNKALWQKFHELETEMIITKSGRRMFPSLHVQVSNLDPHAHYCILLELTAASHCRYKYSNSGGWAPTGAEEAQSPQRIYLHPESPATGEYWMSQPISFGRLKLTNTPAPPAGHLVLSSMHKYQPRIIIAKTSDPRAVAWAPSVSVAFPETQFIAVTAYQNERITKLKIDNNPFAKGFRENGQSKCKRKRVLEEKSEESTKKEARVELPPSPKSEDDRISVCSQSSAPSSPEVWSQRSDISPKSPQNYPIPYSYKPVLPTSVLYPYYYPHYPVYPGVWGATSHFYYQATMFSPHEVVQPVEKKPRKLTDFSIKAITGCS
ncbi:T-box transcription factor mls-1-like [Anoplophora glabripennis]|uniref:T-box transcription factor mls-1-like n=1 Tax=Anoplophora glabripennis TaxID=217634 RepID=UPI0008742393|nr:T-box transcription factor mls-1-like [Anoplophora glabripennis]